MSNMHQTVILFCGHNQTSVDAYKRYSAVTNSLLYKRKTKWNRKWVYKNHDCWSPVVAGITCC